MPPTTRSSMLAKRSVSDDANQATTPDKSSKPAKKKRRKGMKKQDLAAEEPKGFPLEDAEQKISTSSVAVPWYDIFTKGDPFYNEYMATEWSHELRGDQALFECLCLEGAQAGLTWRTILHKREAYRSTFFNFDHRRIVEEMDASDVDRIVSQEPPKGKPQSTVVRHRGKVEAVLHNAQCLLRMQEEARENSNTAPESALDHFLWAFVNDQPILNDWGQRKKTKPDEATSVSLSDFPTKTAESEAMSKALRKLGWKFVGPTTCYAFMQSVGMVIDHPAGTPEWHEAYDRLQKRPGGFQDRRQNP